MKMKIFLLLVLLAAGIFIIFMDFFKTKEPGGKTNNAINNNDISLKKNITIHIDCQYSFEEAISGVEIPDDLRRELVLVDVEYYSFDKNIHRGQVVIHKNLSEDIVNIFQIIKENNFPVDKVIPVVKYSWSDEASMRDNNTSAFNFRKVKGSEKYSAHALGRAIDINPFYNPQLKNNITIPEGSSYNPDIKGTIIKDSFLVKEFRKLGWNWGGLWRRNKDYQHFEKLN
jgi:hypothetical protein